MRTLSRHSVSRASSKITPEPSTPKPSATEPSAPKPTRPAACRAIFEAVEARQLMSADLTAFRSIDGSGNNLANPLWGTPGSEQIRITDAAYADGLSSPTGQDRLSAREISNLVSAHPDGDTPNDRLLSAYAYAWGQFIDHDLDLTNSADPSEPFNIPVPTGDTSFDPFSTGTQVIPTTRSDYVVDENGVRQQTNAITAFIDGSMVYGSDATTAASLREFSGGRLKTSGDNFLPVGQFGFFEAGDIRATENPGLLSLQILFLREHNRLADEISSKNPKLSDEQVFQQARRIVIGEIQSITYNEYLPSLLGDSALRPYTGYNPRVNPQVSLEFSTAAYRFGHSTLEDDVEFLDNNGNEVREEISLADAFFNQAVIEEAGPGSVLKYLASTNAEEIDPYVVDSIRNFLFGPPGAGGLDLASLNIQRGRDHGLDDYNSVRVQLGLPAVTSFSQITSDADLQAALASAYGSVDNIDLWVGGLAEDHARGSSLGPTFSRIIADQFSRTRDGDRFFYLRDLKGKELKYAHNTTLADVIARNTEIYNLQDNVFVFNVQIEGRLFADTNADGRAQRNERGLAGREVTLLDETGEVLQTVTTNRNGDYRFTGAPLGDLSVTTDLQSLTTDELQLILATRGQKFDRVDFGSSPVRSNPTGFNPEIASVKPRSGNLTFSKVTFSSDLLKDPRDSLMLA